VSESLSPDQPGDDHAGLDRARGILDQVYREEHAALVCALIRRFDDVELADDAVADAYEEALLHWRDDGPPPNPAAWLTTTAKRKALDRLRRESTRQTREKEATDMASLDELPLGVVDDDRLRLFFMCCHPALALDVRVALTLRMVSGLSMREIAASFLLEERTMAQRITRAKRKIKDAGIPFRIPMREDLPSRLTGVMAVLYLMYNEGYLSHSDAQATRDDLCLEAIRLSRMLSRLMPREDEVRGLLALLLLTHARRPSRVDGSGLVLFEDQDRTRWDQDMLVEGLRLATDILDGPHTPGQYQLLATIAATHAASGSAETVDWQTVLGLYDLLSATAPTPVVALNRAVALAHVEGYQTALAEVDALDLEQYHPLHVVRAHLLEQLGRRDEARDAIATALTFATNPLERTHLESRLLELTD
jgi:RNA polymerase sigma-70 factor (ECF subfamily)